MPQWRPHLWNGRAAPGTLTCTRVLSGSLPAISSARFIAALVMKMNFFRSSPIPGWRTGAPMVLMMQKFSSFLLRLKKHSISPMRALSGLMLISMAYQAKTMMAMVLSMKTLWIIWITMAMDCGTKILPWSPKRMPTFCTMI